MKGIRETLGIQILGQYPDVGFLLAVVAHRGMKNIEETRHVAACAFSEGMHAVVPTCRVRNIPRACWEQANARESNVRTWQVSSPWPTLRWTCY